MNTRTHCRWASLKIFLWYMLIVTIWILSTDFLFNLIAEDTESLTHFQTIKGFLSLFTIGVVFTLIVHKKIILFTDTNLELTRVLEELKEKNASLMALEEHHYRLAYYDPLTGLFNRHKLEQKVDQLVEENQPFIMIYLDIDHFRSINELKGHQMGDTYLKKIALHLKKFLNDTIISRIGGDEFVIVLKTPNQKVKIDQKCNYILNIIKDALQEDSDIYIQTASAGVALYPKHAQHYQDLLSCADLALSQAKCDGRDRYVIYNQAMFKEKEREASLTQDIRQSLQQGDFWVVYQPILNMKNDKIMKLEALARWNHPKLGSVSPSEFIPLSELSGTIIDITDFVCQKAIEQCASWHRQNMHVDISINISPCVLLDDDFYDRIISFCKTSQLDTKYVLLEITESVLLDQTEASLDLLRRLKGAGFKIALDDFGVGYSSLTYLKHLPCDMIKLDSSFISNIEHDKDEIAFLDFFLDLTHSLKKVVVVEGIETQAQSHILKQYAVDFGQGYHYFRPMRHTDVTQLLKEQFKR